MQILTINEYNDAVFDYLDYLGYESYIVEYDTNDVAQSIGHWISFSYVRGLSVKLCAISVFGATMNIITNEAKGSKVN